MKTLLRTKLKPYWYVSELRGVVYINWVCEKDKEHALDFGAAKDKIDGWIKYVEQSSDIPVEAISDLP